MTLDGGNIATTIFNLSGGPDPVQANSPEASTVCCWRKARLKRT